MQDFRNLEVWNRSHRLVLEVYGATRNFPREELFGITSQVRRSCSSIAANIAEGCGRTQPEFGRFLQMSMGSASESEYHFLLARDLALINEETYKRLNSEVIAIKKMLSVLMQKLKANS